METLEQKLEKVNRVIEHQKYTITNCTNSIGKLEQQKLDLEKQIEESKKPKRERAKEGGAYFYISQIGNVGTDTDDNMQTDTARYKAYNYFLTREEAERTARYEKAARVLDYHIRQFETVNSDEYGYSCYSSDNELLIGLYCTSNGSLPRIKNRPDIAFIIANFSSELRTYLTGGVE